MRNLICKLRGHKFEATFAGARQGVSCHWDDDIGSECVYEVACSRCKNFGVLGGRALQHLMTELWNRMGD